MAVQPYTCKEVVYTWSCTFGISVTSIHETQDDETTDGLADLTPDAPITQLTPWVCSTTSTVQPNVSTQSVAAKNAEIALLSDNSSECREVLTISSDENTVVTRCLILKETKSDFMEDHLLKCLDAGKYNSKLYFNMYLFTKYILSLQQIQIDKFINIYTLK